MRYGELRGRLIQFAKTGDEAHRITQSPLLSYENAIKVRRNHLRALLDDSLLARKQREEQELREAVQADPEMRAAYGSAWNEIADALTQLGFTVSARLVAQVLADYGLSKKNA